MSGAEDGFAIFAPAWRVRRLRAALRALAAAGRAARDAGELRIAPEELTHRAEARCWFGGWDRPGMSAVPVTVVAAPKPLNAGQIARLARWQAGGGGLRPTEAALRRSIIETVADAMLGARPLAFGAIAAAHRETARRCRAAGLPAPKVSKYRRWLKLTGRATGPAPKTPPHG